ncbi:MAG TPA: DNA alkylation repair protein [Pseudobdellovibrionaceae bacterium]|nr:DNA alkylation repair protein [Pseudobdellovibrionaceae bacterium]
MPVLIDAQKALRKKASAAQRQTFLRFFKTGPGQYGEGDVFIGVPVRHIRALSKSYRTLTPKDLSVLLQSPVHEDRHLGLIVLVDQYARTKDLKGKKQLVEFYMKNRSGVNNWDLVDVSAHKILGDHCFRTADPSVLRKLTKSKRHWDRRMAMLGTAAFIWENDLDLTFEFAEIFLSETEDLMHKVTGWMLREAGKKDLPRLRRFIQKHGPRIPRTTLRYAIEKMIATERKKILASTKT